MKWPPAPSPEDTVIARQDPSTGSRFVLHGNHVAQIACATYAEAEARAASYAERARASVWYLENGQLRLVCSFVRGHAGDRLLKKDANAAAPAHSETTGETP